MRFRHLLMASASTLVLSLADAHQGQATIVLDHGSSAANSAVESGGHRVAPGAVAPVSLLLAGFGFSPCCLCPWDGFAVPPLPRLWFQPRWRPLILRTPNGRPFIRLER
jgi:hypothetical protein